jgi:hypothetical protein
VASPASDASKPHEYDAFLSYAHRDRHVTTAIQKGLHQIGRRLGRLRALQVFRDDTNLAASPDLWGRITEALDSDPSDPGRWSVHCSWIRPARLRAKHRDHATFAAVLV